jgi:hypothetical protein
MGLVPLPKVTLVGSHGKKDDSVIALKIPMAVKQGKFECIKCMNKGDELHDVSTCSMKFLKCDPF